MFKKKKSIPSISELVKWPLSTGVHKCQQCGKETPNSRNCDDTYADYIRYGTAVEGLLALEREARLFNQALDVWYKDHPALPGGEYRVSITPSADEYGYSYREVLILDGAYAGVKLDNARETGPRDNWFSFTQDLKEQWLNEKGFKSRRQLDRPTQPTPLPEQLGVM